MTSPAEPPANALDDARHALHAALVATFELVGWSPERADAYPPATIRTPGGWVDAPTLSHQGVGLVATFPVVIGVDGTDKGQLKRLDAVLAAGWRALEGVRLANESLPRILTAGPDDLDLGSITGRAVVFSVQIDLAARTLCPEPLTRSDDAP